MGGVRDEIGERGWAGGASLSAPLSRCAWPPQPFGQPLPVSLSVLLAHTGPSAKRVFMSDVRLGVEGLLEAVMNIVEGLLGLEGGWVEGLLSGLLFSAACLHG